MIRIILVGLLFIIQTSCTSGVNEGVQVESSVVEQKSCDGKDCLTCELPWGGTLASGQSIESTFSKEIVTCSDSCENYKVKMNCNEGQLETSDLKTGLAINLESPLFQKCYKQRCDCEQNGTVIKDGESKDFFPQQVTSCTQQCESRKLKCDSGGISDLLMPTQKNFLSSHIYSACNHIECSDCTTPWGAKVKHNEKIRAYKSQTVSCGSNCNGEFVDLTCSNGALSGGSLATYKFASCSMTPCLNCELSPGNTIAHNSSIPSFKVEQAECNTTCSTQSATLTCNNGVVSGGSSTEYKYISCSQKACAICRICNGNVASGGTRTCFKESKPAACGLSCSTESHQFSCDNGVIKKADNSLAEQVFVDLYNKSSCNELSSCSSCELSDGRKIIDGKKITFFKKSRVNCGEQCFGTTNAVTLTCSNGSFANKALYSDFDSLNCEADCTGTSGDLGIGRIEGDGGGAPRTMCQLPWLGGYASHKTQVVAFSKLVVEKNDKCANYKRLIECDGYRGLWSGGAVYIYPTCTEKK